jgi:hypothetical protein
MSNRRKRKRSFESLFIDKFTENRELRCCHGLTDKVRFPSVSLKVWKFLNAQFPELQRQSYPGKYRPCTLSIQSLSDASANVYCVLRVLMCDGAYIYEYSLFNDHTLVTRTKVTAKGRIEWQYIGGFLQAPYHLAPMLLLLKPSMVRYVPSDVISRCLEHPCECYDCSVLEGTFPCLFGNEGNVWNQYPGLLKLLQHCNATRKHLCAPYFDCPLSLELKFETVITRLQSKKVAKIPPKTSRGWYTSKAQWISRSS